MSYETDYNTHICVYFYSIAPKSIKEQRLLPDITLSELTQEISSIKSSRNLLNIKFETTVNEINQFNEIKAAAQEKKKENNHPSL
ncbi:helical hairpin domain-containing protein [Lactococcus formosensis]|uniref:helical hairpin domain-containing protein n=1 Tax=Lactococcus formosensis TaxID=1281486 RepID=UPI0039F6F696